MKVVQFTIPVANEQAVLIQEDILPHFYNHLHRHKEVQITWILKGKGTLIAGNYMQIFKEGEVYILGSNQPHIFKSDKSFFARNSKQKVHSITIFFNQTEFVNSLLQVPEARKIKRFLELTTHGFKIPTNKLELVTNEIMQMKTKKEGYKLASFLRLLQLLADIKNWNALATVATESSFSDSEGLRMNAIYQYTLSHYAENIKLKEVANIAYLTPQAFCRYFKKHTRKTYFDFLNEIRVNEACKKLIANNFYSVSAIAMETGFKSVTNFCRVFKKISSHSPLQYRSMYKENAEENF